MGPVHSLLVWCSRWSWPHPTPCYYGTVNGAVPKPTGWQIDPIPENLIGRIIKPCYRSAVQYPAISTGSTRDHEVPRAQGEPWPSVGLVAHDARSGVSSSVVVDWWPESISASESRRSETCWRDVMKLPQRPVKSFKATAPNSRVSASTTKSSRPHPDVPASESNQDPAPRLLRLREVQRRVSLSRATIWRLERRGEFPKRHRVSAGAVAWLERDIDQWIEKVARGERETSDEKPRIEEKLPRGKSARFK
jgi:prophage regulatory protein